MSDKVSVIVVGCGNMICNEKKKECTFDEHCLNSGDYISIDGHEGSVYLGKIKIKDA